MSLKQGGAVFLKGCDSKRYVILQASCGSIVGSLACTAPYSHPGGHALIAGRGQIIPRPLIPWLSYVAKYIRQSDKLSQLSIESILRVERTTASFHVTAVLFHAGRLGGYRC